MNKTLNIMENTTTLSIVTTLYYSAEYIEEFYQRASKEAQKITDNYEIIFVDDGSPDDSLQKAINIHQRDSKVIVAELSRNFGHHKAMTAGLTLAKGEYIFLIDSDLEEEPELLSLFWQELSTNSNIDVVYGVQEKRKGGWFERWSGQLYWQVFNKLSNIKVPESMIVARLFKKSYNDAFLQYNEKEYFIGGVWYLAGFHQKSMVVKKGSRSPSTYTFSRKISLFVNSVTSFSNKPLYFIFLLGSVISGVSLIVAVFLIYKKLIANVDVDGWTSIIASIWLLGGLIIFCIGILGVYLAKVYSETKQRPNFIMRNVYKS